MTLREQMHSLVEDIISAGEVRSSDLVSLHQQVAAQRDEVRTQLQRVHSGRLSSAHQMRSALNKERLELAQGESQRSTEFWAWLGDVAGARQDVAHQMRSALNKGRLGLAQGESQRSKAVQAWIGDVAGARQDMAHQVHTVLTSGRLGLARAEAQRGSRVRGWLRELSGERQAAQIEWRHLATPRGKRAGTSKVSEATEEFSRVRERVFEGLADHPDGLRLKEIEREFGMSRFESNRVVKSLINSGKAEKRGLLYFAI